MPELPEVETTRRGVAPHLEQQRVTQLVVRQPRLRWPIPDQLAGLLENRTINRVSRRAKYLLLEFDHGTLIIHLGMSGSLRILPQGTPHGKHDHVDVALNNGQLLRYNDPRRFGAILWSADQISEHPLLQSLGPEPLSEAFNAATLINACQNKTTPIKSLLMNNTVVVGVGNIYACESLFRSGIAPKRAAGKVSARRLTQLAENVKAVLSSAIEQGGTTLKDFTNSDGKPGYFKQQLAVYGREGEPCVHCDQPIKRIIIGQRSTFYCPRCQR